MVELASRAARCADGAADDLLDQLPDALLGIDRTSRIILANEAAGVLFGLGRDELLGRAARDILPEWPVEASSAASQPPSSTTIVHRSIEMTAQHASGASLHLELSTRGSRGTSGSRLLITLRDISERKQVERRKTHQTAELAAINAELLVLYEVSSTVNRSLDLDTMLTEVLRTITRLEFLQLEPRGAIFVVDGGQMRLAAHLGQHPAFLRSHQGIPAGRCHCGHVAKTGQPLRISVCHQGRYPGLDCGTTPDHGHMIVPLKVNELVVGVLCLYIAAGALITDAVMRTLITAGNHVGLAIENARLYDRARQSALHDALTGLANRRLVDLFLERQLARSKRSAAPFSVIMLDIDHFKRFNDEHGHPAGDGVLARVAQIVTSITRDADLAARYGGEEFLVLLPDTTAHRAADVAERLRETIASATPITVSVGVATSYGHLTDQDELVRQADAAMYEAKRSGRNRLAVARGGRSDVFATSQPLAQTSQQPIAGKSTV